MSASMHDALAAEHRARHAMQAGQWEIDNAAPPEPDEADEALTPEAIAEDVADEWTRNPAAIANWLNDQCHKWAEPLPYSALRSVAELEGEAAPAPMLALLFGGPMTTNQMRAAVASLQRQFSDAIKRDSHYIEQCNLRGKQ